MVPIRSTDVMHLWRRTECRNVGYCKKKALFKTVVIVATVGSSQSEREKVNRGIGEWGHVTSLAYDTSQFGHMTPFRPIRAQYSVTVPQTPGSDRATGSDSPVHRKWLHNRKLLPRPPEVTARPEGKKLYPSTALLHNEITGHYICVGCCTLTLVVLFWGDYQQRMRVE